MNITATGGAVTEAPQDNAHGHAHGPLYKLVIGAIGIVYGDIGTSPIYAFRETFAGHHTLIPDKLHIYGVLSLIFYSMMIIVTIKYVTIIMRADNKGEGGSLALLALINRTLSGKKRWTSGIVMLGVFATALFYGDSMITPAISVLSAVEGLTTVNAGLEPFVIPIAIGILVGLFAIQSRGTARVGLMFGPVMIFYFVTLAVLGVMHIMNYPAVVVAMFNPLNAVRFFTADFMRAFIAMGSVVLAVTGAEALYADMGHFGRKPIRISWIYFVLPALLLNYMGQGAMILSADPATALAKVKDPFFYLAPDQLRLPPHLKGYDAHGILAYSRICTHAGCAITLYRAPLFQPDEPRPALVCPCHYSTFDPTTGGTVTFGPAGRDLPLLPLYVDSAGYLRAKGNFDRPVGPSWWGVRLWKAQP